MNKRFIPSIALSTLVLLGLSMHTDLHAQTSTDTRKAGTLIQDCPPPQCPTMVYIPAGSFMMGALPSEPEFIPHEPADPKATPRHKVTFAKPFAMGQHEVTKEMFAEFFKATRHQTSRRCSLTGPTVQYLHGFDWRSPTAEQWSDDEPVLCTNYYDAVAYAAWLTKKTGHVYRLPSEAEWEYAARAGTETHWFWGNDMSTACKYAHGFEQWRNTGNPEIAKQLCTHRADMAGRAHVPVKAYQPNPWGLYGLVGNTWELAADCWHQDYTGAPADGSAWIDDPTCNLRITRGDGGGPGTWSWHSHRYPVFADEHRSNTGSFRLVRELAPDEM